MLKKIIDSMSWKNLMSRPLAPFIKLAMDFYDRNLRPKAPRVYRMSTVFTTMRDAANPPMPLHFSDDWESEQNAELRNKIAAEMIIVPENQYYFDTEKDFPIRENPDYIDFVLDHAMYHKTKQFCFLEKAHQMEKQGVEVGNINRTIRELDEYRYQQLDSILVPKL